MPTPLVFGVEVEVLLNLLRKPQDGFPDVKDLDTFATILIPYFNEKTNGEYKMLLDIDGCYEGKDQHLHWSITDDSTIITQKANQCQYTYIIYTLYI